VEPDELARRLSVAALQFPRLLRCDQCAKASDERARGWRGYRVGDEGAIDGLIVVVYCPACVERIFGE
jgi:hypothetical protein